MPSNLKMRKTGKNKLNRSTINNKTALVTGGSGALGSAIVRNLVSNGWRVAFTWIVYEEEVRRLTEETGAAGFQIDLVDAEQVEKGIRDILSELGRIDGLVNNAGLIRLSPFVMIDEKDWDDVIAANLKSMFLVTREVARGMIYRKSGVIVNIGSVAGHRMGNIPVHYATAKAAVTGFTISLAKELSRYNIRVNEVVPGLVSKGLGAKMPEKYLKQLIDYCAAGRPGEPEEVANAAAFLMSDAASYINAQSVFVDGGL